MGDRYGMRMEDLAIYASSLVIQVGYGVLGVVMKTQLSNGMNSLLFVVYSNAFGSLVLGPFAFFLEKKERTRMSWSLAAQFFVLSLWGISAFQELLLMGLKNTTPAIASAMPNLGPAIIFVMAWGLGMEKVDIKRIHSRLKIFGTLVCVGGALAMSFLQGPAIHRLWSRSITTVVSIPSQENSDTKIIGCIYLSSAVVMLSCAVLLQAVVLKKYPAALSLSAITAFVASFQTAILKIIIERGFHKISWSIDRSGLLTIVYVGIICNGLAFALQIWCLKKRGPVFVAIFSPIATVCSVVLSGETLRLGSLLGVLLIFFGLYLVLWGKNNDKPGEEALSSQQDEEQSNRTTRTGNHSYRQVDGKTPLLLHHLGDVD